MLYPVEITRKTSPPPCSRRIISVHDRTAFINPRPIAVLVLDPVLSRSPLPIRSSAVLFAQWFAVDRVLPCRSHAFRVKSRPRCPSSVVPRPRSTNCFYGTNTVRAILCYYAVYIYLNQLFCCNKNSISRVSYPDPCRVG